MHLAQSKRTLTEDCRPPLCAGSKRGEVAKALLWQRLHEDPACPSRVLLAQVAHTQHPLAVSVRQLHRWRVTWPRHRGKGRPRRVDVGTPRPSRAGVVPVTPRLSCVGVHLLAHWLAHQEAVAPVWTRLKQAIEA